MKNFLLGWELFWTLTHAVWKSKLTTMWLGYYLGVRLLVLAFQVLEHLIDLMVATAWR